MRHKKHHSRLGRDSGHRTATLRNLAKGLVEHGRIETTVVKAKVLRPFIEKMITHGKKGTLAHRRLAMASLANKDVVGKIFHEIAPRFKDRPGGYTRIIRNRRRLGDGAETAFIEFVDYDVEEAVGTTGSAPATTESTPNPGSSES